MVKKFNKEEHKKYLREIGFNEKEIEKKLEQREQMVELMKKNINKPPREITSTTYERAQKKLDNKIKKMFENR